MYYVSQLQKSNCCVPFDHGYHELFSTRPAAFSMWTEKGAGSLRFIHAMKETQSSQLSGLQIVNVRVVDLDG
jgi:hypothetical protein